MYAKPIRLRLFYFSLGSFVLAGKTGSVVQRGIFHCQAGESNGLLGSCVILHWKGSGFLCVWQLPHAPEI